MSSRVHKISKLYKESGSREAKQRSSLVKQTQHAAQRVKKSQGKLEAMTYNQLMELARKVNLTGRSKMKKVELIRALGAHG